MSGPITITSWAVKRRLQVAQACFLKMGYDYLLQEEKGVCCKDNLDKAKLGFLLIDSIRDYACMTQACRTFSVVKCEEGANIEIIIETTVIAAGTTVGSNTTVLATGIAAAINAGTQTYGYTATSNSNNITICGTNGSLSNGLDIGATSDNVNTEFSLPNPPILTGGTDFVDSNEERCLTDAQVNNILAKLCSLCTCEDCKELLNY